MPDIAVWVRFIVLSNEFVSKYQLFNKNSSISEVVRHNQTKIMFKWIFFLQKFYSWIKFELGNLEIYDHLHILKHNMLHKYIVVLEMSKYILMLSTISSSCLTMVLVTPLKCARSGTHDAGCCNLCKYWWGEVLIRHTEYMLSFLYLCSNVYFNILSS